MRLPWVEWEFEDSPVREVAEQFVVANCYDPKIAMLLFDDGDRYRDLTLSFETPPPNKENGF
jgi:putative transposase